MTDEQGNVSLRDLDAYWRAANFLSVGQIFLCWRRHSIEPILESVPVFF